MKASTQALAELLEVMADGIVDDRLRLRSLYVVRSYFLEERKKLGVGVGARAERRIANATLSGLLAVGAADLSKERSIRLLSGDLLDEIWMQVSPRKALDAVCLRSELHGWDQVVGLLCLLEYEFGMWPTYDRGWATRDMSQRLEHLVLWLQNQDLNYDQHKRFLRLSRAVEKSRI